LSTKPPFDGFAEAIALLVERAYIQTDVGPFSCNLIGSAPMIATASQYDFYQEFLMTRGLYDPMDFGVNMTRKDFMDQILEEFGIFTHGQLSTDELLYRPAVAMDFCHHVRRKFGYFDVPDDIILRATVTLRKRAKGGKRKKPEGARS
jgi:hypothetical protein